MSADAAEQSAWVSQIRDVLTFLQEHGFEKAVDAVYSQLESETSERGRPVEGIAEASQEYEQLDEPGADPENPEPEEPRCGLTWHGGLAARSTTRGTEQYLVHAVQEPIGAVPSRGDVGWGQAA